MRKCEFYEVRTLRGAKVPVIARSKQTAGLLEVVLTVTLPLSPSLPDPRQNPVSYQ